jgi:hypothetical protein
MLPEKMEKDLAVVLVETPGGVQVPEEGVMDRIEAGVAQMGELQVLLMEDTGGTVALIILVNLLFSLFILILSTCDI